MKLPTFLPDPKPHYNTLSSLIRLLEEKGYVGHKAYGNTHEYFPLITKEEYQREFMSDIVENYFGKSYKNVVSFFAQEQNISVEELKEIIAMIEKGKVIFIMESEDDSKKIHIRSDSKGDDFMIVIDGKVSNQEALNNLDADKVYSISILKKEEAVEEYGEKAKNGVIKIKTKK